MKPKPNTIQWLAPHLSDGECKHIKLRYKWFRPVCGDCGIHLTVELLQQLTVEAQRQTKQYKELSRLFGKEA